MGKESSEIIFASTFTTRHLCIHVSKFFIGLVAFVCLLSVCCFKVALGISRMNVDSQ